MHEIGYKNCPLKIHDITGTPKERWLWTRLLIRGLSYRPLKAIFSGTVLRYGLKPCMTEIYSYIDARMAYYIHTHPYVLATAVAR